MESAAVIVIRIAGHFLFLLSASIYAELIISPLCSCRAGEVQTLRHLILSCGHSRMERKALNEAFGKRRKLRLQPLLHGKSSFEPLRNDLVAAGIARREWRLGHLRRDPGLSGGEIGIGVI
jgi:hypothetical protein